MIHQYHAQRHQGGKPHGVGTVPVGTVVYIQDHIGPLTGFRVPIVCRNPWIVEAWLNRVHEPTGNMLAGGHLAEVRSLRDGRRQLVADWILLRCVDAGLTREA